MAYVLTSGSTVQCSHKATVVLNASQSRLKAGGNPVLVATDLVGATVSACPNTNAAAGQKPCLTTLSVLNGTAQKLSVGGTPVLLDNATGPTDSTPPGTWSVTTAGQTVLKAS